jgi:hypothetical protein
MIQQREAMTQGTSTSQPAGGPDAPGGTPYPDIAHTSHAAAAAAAFFRSFFTAKTSKDAAWHCGDKLPRSRARPVSEPLP